ARVGAWAARAALACPDKGVGSAFQPRAVFSSHRMMSSGEVGAEPYDGDQSNWPCRPGGVSKRTVALLDGTAVRSSFRYVWTAVGPPAFLKYLGLRDLADLPPLPELDTRGPLTYYAAPPVEVAGRLSRHRRDSSPRRADAGRLASGDP